MTWPTDPTRDEPETLRQLRGRWVFLRRDLGEVHKVYHPLGLWDVPGHLRARRRAGREWAALQHLFHAGVPVPEPLGLEHSWREGWRLRMAELPGARTAEEALEESLDPRALLVELARLLARLQLTGLDHGDLHAGNALVTAEGKAWAIDFQDARLARPVSAARLERDLVVVAAAWRERLGAREQARFLLAWLAVLEAEAPALVRELLAAGGRIGLAGRVDLGARRRRRGRVAEAATGRWLRVSSSCGAPLVKTDEKVHVGTRPRVLVARPLHPNDEDAALEAMARTVDGERPERRDLVLSFLEEGERAVELSSGAAARAAWNLAARCRGHGLPGPRPLVHDRGGPDGEALTLVAFAAGGRAWDAGPARAVEPLALPPTPAERAPLDALLADRGLRLASDVPAAYRRLTSPDGSVVLGLSTAARLVDRPLGPGEEAAAARRTTERAARRERRAGRLAELPRLFHPALRPLTHGALAMATAAARWSPLERRLARHLAIAFPDLDAAALAARTRAARRHLARQVRELGRFGRGAEREAAWLDDLVTVDDSVAHLEELVAAGRGAIVITPHLGNWELLAATLRRHGFDGAVVGRRRARDPGGTWLEELRSRWGVTTLAQDVSPRELLRRLKGGEVIGLLPDVEVPRLAGLRTDFLGRDALVMTAPAALARAARLPLLPARCVAEGAGYRLSFGEPLVAPSGSDSGDPRDPRPLTEAWVRLFEAWIRETPEQWIWYHDRWRTPPGPADGVPLAALRHAQRP